MTLARPFPKRLGRGRLVAALLGILVARLVQALLMVADALFNPWDTGHGPGDLYTYLTATAFLKEGRGAAIYDSQAFFAAQVAHGLSNPLPYPYHAAWLIAVYPISFLPVGPAYLAWIILGGSILAGSLVALTRGFVPPGQRLVFVLLVLISQPVLLTIRSGQSTFALLLALTLAVIGILDRRDCLAGLGLAAMLIKPQLLPLLLLLLAWQRRWRALAWFVAGGAATLVVSWVLVGTAGLLGEVRLLADGRMSFAFPWSHTLLGLATVIVGPGWAAVVYPALASVVLGTFALVLTRAGAARERELVGLAILGGLLVSPYAYVYDLTLWTVPAALFWVDLRRGRGIYLLVAGLIVPPLAMSGPLIAWLYQGTASAVWATVAVALLAFGMLARRAILPGVGRRGRRELRPFLAVEEGS
jgi:hypothetical protein